MTGPPPPAAVPPRHPEEVLADQAARAERLGRWDEAAALFARAFRTALGPGRVEAAVDALRGQARIRRVQGRLAEAEELALLSLEIAERHGLARSAARAVNVLAWVHHAQQDWDGARTLYEQALERALEIGDDELTGLACLNLGVVANMQGELRDSRIRYLESIGSAVRSGNKHNEVMAYNNLGLVCTDLGEWMEAEVFFSRGIEIAERIGTPTQAARLYMNRAEPLILTGEAGRARETLDRAEALAQPLDEREVLVTVSRFRAMADRMEGRLDDAERHLENALALARAAKLEMERAETLQETAALRMRQGRHHEGRALLEEARGVFTRLGIGRNVRRVDELLATLDAAAGPPAADAQATGRVFGAPEEFAQSER